MTLMNRLNLRSRATIMAALSLLAVACLPGCGKRAEIRTYEVAPAELSLPFACDVPKSWGLADNDAFSVLAFAVSDDPSTKMTITRLRASDNYVVANANRWRVNQMGLTPINDASELPDAEFANATGKLVAIEGRGKGMRAAIVEHRGQPWTFKLSGSPKQVEAAAEKFDAFIKSVEFFKTSGDK